MDKVAAAIFQEILTQPQYEKVAMCLYKDIQLRTAEKLASLGEMEKIAYNESLYKGNYAKNLYTNSRGPDIGERIRNAGNKFLQGVKDIPGIVRGTIANPKRMRNAFNMTVAGISPSDMENSLISNVFAGHSTMGNIASAVGTGIDALNFISKLKNNFGMPR